MVYINVVEYTPFDKPTKVTEGKVNGASVVQCQSKHLSPQSETSVTLGQTRSVTLGQTRCIEFLPEGRSLH